MSRTQSLLRRGQLHLFRRCYCACRDHGAGYVWGIPVPLKRLAYLNARHHDKVDPGWYVVRFSARHQLVEFDG